MRLASYVPGELIPLPLSGSIPELPHVEKGGCCDAEVSVIQSVQLAGLKIMMGHRQVEQAALIL
jgi:hypothetical protein